MYLIDGFEVWRSNREIAVCRQGDPDMIHRFPSWKEAIYFIEDCNDTGVWVRTGPLGRMVPKAVTS